MDLFIECPVCEQQFSCPAGPAEQTLTCPDCSRQFPRSAAELVDPPTVRRADPFDTRLHVPNAVPMAEAAVVKPTVDAPEPTATVVTSPILALHRKRQTRRRLITTLVSSLVLATIIGVLAGLLYKQLRRPSLTQSPIPESPVHLDVSPPPEDTASTTSTTPNQPPSPDPELLPIAAEDIPPQQLNFLDQRAFDDRWLAVQPHLVSLKIYDGLGTHQAVGTIVDSRGWILTSYNAVKGASKIEVTASASSIDHFWDADLLTDTVRGFVAAQPEDDLVLLAINRRFIVAFSTVQPASINNVVASEYLAQCAPPSRVNLYGATETRIEQRAKPQDLAQRSQQIATRKGLDRSGLIWLTAPAKSTSLPGTPLFKIDGPLAAFHVFTANQKDYFLPVDQVSQLIAKANPDIQPLNKLSGSEGSVAPVSLPTTHEMYAPSIRLNQLAETCNVFGWIPQTQQDYNVFMEFAAAYATIEKYASKKSGSNVPEEKLIIDQMKQLQNQLQQRASSLSLDDELELTKMNKQFAAHQLQTGNQHVPFYGQVHFVDIVNAQVVVKFFGSETYVQAPFIPSDDPMRMQTKWLFFGETSENPRPVNYRISESEKVTAEALQRLTNFGDQ